MQAYCTLVYSPEYLPGALVLGHRLRELDAHRQRVVLVTPSCGAAELDRLAQVFDLVKEVEPIFVGHTPEFASLERPELDGACTKFHAWGLTQFEAVLFLDADTLPLAPLFELFAAARADAIAAAPDVGWPDLFNSGVFAIKPSLSVLEDLVELAQHATSLDGADQGVLNDYFEENWTRVSFLYNVTLSASYMYVPAFNRFENRIKVLHFIGPYKPWNTSRAYLDDNSASKRMLDAWDTAARSAGVVPTGDHDYERASFIKFNSAALIPPPPTRWDATQFAPMRHTGPEAAHLFGAENPDLSESHTHFSEHQGPGGRPVRHQDTLQEPERRVRFTAPVELGKQGDGYIFPSFGPEVYEFPWENYSEPAERVFYE